MRMTRMPCTTGFSPVFGVPAHIGTNGQISSWGPLLSGTAPRVAQTERRNA